MREITLFPLGSTAACRYAAEFLARSSVTLVDHPTPEVTHLLLDVPSFAPNGTLRGGGDIVKTLQMLPPDTVVIGGNLSHPALAYHTTIDLLKIADFLAQNAAITADCALQVAAPLLSATFSETPTLIIGWGRIGKCLSKLLKSIGSPVTVAARKETDRAMLNALGYDTVDIPDIPKRLPKIRLLFNTVPELVLPKEQLSLYRNCVKIELASKTGIESDDVVIARGLPGVHAPESSGRLIAQTILNLL